MTSLFNKLKQALTNSSTKISKGIDHIFFKKKLDDQTLKELKELLILADIGNNIASKLIAELKVIKFGKEVNSGEIKEALAELILRLFNKVDNWDFKLNYNGLNIILVCGVNGNGKTTTVGKMAANYINQGKKVAIAACDTFRAAATEQLAVWADRAGALLITGAEGADPASVAYNALQQSLTENIDILFIDTAGRLHNYKNLMEELNKIVRVIKKLDISAPHHSLLVIDATTGQNAYNQVEQFVNIAGVTGIVVTKLDGTAKAGVIVGIVPQFSLPVHFVGVGEKLEDLKPFNATDFVRALVGL